MGRISLESKTLSKSAQNHSSSLTLRLGSSVRSVEAKNHWGLTVIMWKTGSQEEEKGILKEPCARMLEAYDLEKGKPWWSVGFCCYCVISHVFCRSHANPTYFGKLTRRKHVYFSTILHL